MLLQVDLPRRRPPLCNLLGAHWQHTFLLVCHTIHCLFSPSKMYSAAHLLRAVCVVQPSKKMTSPPGSPLVAQPPSTGPSTLPLHPSLHNLLVHQWRWLKTNCALHHSLPSQPLRTSRWLWTPLVVAKAQLQDWNTWPPSPKSMGGHIRHKPSPSISSRRRRRRVRKVVRFRLSFSLLWMLYGRSPLFLPLLLLYLHHHISKNIYGLSHIWVRYRNPPELHVLWWPSRLTTHTGIQLCLCVCARSQLFISPTIFSHIEVHIGAAITFDPHLYIVSITLNPVD